MKKQVLLICALALCSGASLIAEALTLFNASANPIDVEVRLNTERQRNVLVAYNRIDSNTAFTFDLPEDYYNLFIWEVINRLRSADNLHQADGEDFASPGSYVYSEGYITNAVENEPEPMDIEPINIAEPIDIAA